MEKFYNGFEKQASVATRGVVSKVLGFFRKKSPKPMAVAPKAKPVPSKDPYFTQPTLGQKTRYTGSTQTARKGSAAAADDRILRYDRFGTPKWVNATT